MSCNKVTFRLVESYLRCLNTPRSLAIWLLFKNNEHDQLIALDIDPSLYLDPQMFRLDYLATKFLSKADFLSTSVDKKSVALKGFLDAENRCREINRDAFSTSYLKHKRFEWLHSAISRKIERTLSDFSADEFFDSANWGPGVTLNKLVKRDTSSTNKFRHEGGITHDLRDFIGELHALAYPTWKVNFSHEIGNKIVTVPKNSKTDRTIAIEPGINLWYQKAIGTMIRRRLYRLGCNLNSQERNQKLARLSSKTGHLATIDFSQASDSISLETVRALLPARWFLLMDITRSQFGSIDNQVLRYEKFSSMGNGFTFELESLIFLAIALSVCKYLQVDSSEVSVYGDDVVIPVECVDLFREICAIYGFTVNIQKSYSTGYFRESCGEHFFAGINCKPYFLRKVVSNEKDIYLAANSIRRVSHNKRLCFCDIRFLSVWQYLVSRVKRPCKIPDGYGDGGLVVNFDEASPPRARHQIEGFVTRALVDIPLGYFSDDHALLLARLKGRSVDIGLNNQTFIRNRTKVLRKKLFVRQWANLGPWI